MDHASALEHLENLRRQLDKVAEEIRLIQRVDLASPPSSINNIEAVKSAARNFASTATEIARDAVQICIRLDALPQACEPKRRSKKLSN
jgi:hypothetical protein